MGERLEVIDELERRLLDACYRGPSWLQRARSRRAWIPATLTAAAAAAALAFVLLPGGEVSPSLAQAALSRAARAAGNSPSTALSPGRQWYVRAITTFRVPLVIPSAGPVSAVSLSDSVPVIDRTLRQVWMKRDGASRSLNRFTMQFANQTAAARYGRKLQGPQVTRTRTPPNSLLSSPLGSPHLLTYGQLRSLPTSVSGLRRVIRRIQAQLRLEAAPVPAQPQTPAAPTAQATLPAQNAVAPIVAPAPTKALPVPSRSTSAQTPVTPAVPRATATTQAATTSTVEHNGTTSEVLTLQMTATVVGRCCGSTPVARSAAGDLEAITWLLALPVPAAVRAALYRTAASLPGVNYHGAARDSLGRRGVEISVGSGDDEMRMIFDPGTGALLATSSSFGPTAFAHGIGATTETIAAEKVVNTP